MIEFCRRLLQQGSEAVERERQLRQTERLYLNLRQVLAKQPGPEIQTELCKTQRVLKNRGDKLKVGFLSGSNKMLLYLFKNNSFTQFIRF